MGQAHTASGGRSRSEVRTGAVIVDRNRSASKRLARILVSAGYTVKTYEEDSPPFFDAVSDADIDLWLLVGQAACQKALLDFLNRQAHPENQRQPKNGPCFGVLYGLADELDLQALCEVPGILAVLGQRPEGAGGGQLEMETQLLGVASHLRGQALPPLQAFLLWGAPAFSTTITNIAGRDAAEARIVKLCSDQLNTSRRIAASVGEVVHELVTNAMYDAPVDTSGRPLYAHDRTAPITLSQEDRVTFRYGTDGLRLVVEAVDRFGRLQRKDVLRSLRRAAAGQINHAEGGAGIGLSMVLRACYALQVDVEPGARTRITAVLDLDVHRPSEGARPGRSLIFPDLTNLSSRRDF